MVLISFFVCKLAAMASASRNELLCNELFVVDSDGYSSADSKILLTTASKFSFRRISLYWLMKGRMSEAVGA